MKINKKTSLALAILIIFLVFIFLIWKIFFSSGDDEVYLLPNNFTGIVTIIYDVKDGTPIKLENNIRTFEIPTGGILKTNMLLSNEFHNEFYYYIDVTGKRKEIFFKIPADSNYKGVQIMGNRSGTAISPSGKQVVFFRFAVCDFAKADSLGKIMEKTYPGKYVN